MGLLSYVCILLLSQAAAAERDACQGQLDAWCSRNCDIPCGKGQKLFALRDVGAASHGQGHAKMWRCYSANNTNADHTAYNGGVCYCTRDQPLTKLACRCNASSCASTPVPVPVPQSSIIFAANDTIKSCYRNPALLQTASGDLLCFIEERYRGSSWNPQSDSHSCADNYHDGIGGHNLGFARSTDGGKSWAPIVRLAGNLTNLGALGGVDWTNNAVLRVKMPSGKERLLWQYGSQNNPSLLQHGRIFQRTSDDNGHTWSDPLDLTYASAAVGFPGGTPGPGAGVQMPSGRLVFCAWGNNSSKPCSDKKGWNEAVNFGNFLTCSCI